MVTTTREPERAYLIKLAEDYRSKGYEIKFQPDPETLPEFLRGYKPDMLALGGDESVVVEVKARPLIKRDSNYLKSLSKSVEDHPGWRFELVVLATNGDQEGFELDRLPEARESLIIEEITPGLQFAKQLAMSQPESALLYVWSLTEAILRLLARHEEVSLKTFDALYMLKTLVSEGVISRSDYQSLIDNFPLRNAIAHGFKADRLTTQTVDNLVNLAENLLLLLGSEDAGE